MSRLVLVSTFTSRTEIALPSSIIGSQVTPPFLDFTIDPPTRIWSYGSPSPRYKVFGFLPKATEPPPVVGRSSVRGVQSVLGDVQLSVFHRPPPELRK